MQRFRGVVVALALTAASAAVYASDPVAVYARVDRVVLEPDATAPRTIKVYGVFSVAAPDNPSTYQSAARGYLYFTLANNEALAKREWADLKAVAGTKQIVAFGSRFGMKPRLRKDADTAAEPDGYATGNGVTKVSGDTDYAPIRALIDFKA